VTSHCTSCTCHGETPSHPRHCVSCQCTTHIQSLPTGKVKFGMRATNALMAVDRMYIDSYLWTKWKHAWNATGPEIDWNDIESVRALLLRRSSFFGLTPYDLLLHVRNVGRKTARQIIVSVMG
jgi:hypothetical protein